MIDAVSDDTKPSSFLDPSLTWTDEAAPAEASSASTDPQPTDTATAPSPAAATTPPAPEPTTGEAPLDSGPIPLDRHKAILDAERKKYGDLDAKWQRVAWADELVSAGKTADQVKQGLALFDSLSRQEPTQLLETLYEELKNHPQFAPQVRSWAGKVLAGGRQPL